MIRLATCGCKAAIAAIKAKCPRHSPIGKDYLKLVQKVQDK